MKNDHGFTLLEVIVALTILAITLGAIIKTSFIQVENARYLRDKTLAHWVALNVITEIQLRQSWPEVGQQKGQSSMAGREWDWSVQVAKTIDEKLRRLDIQVYEHAEAKTPITSLVGFVGAPF